MTKLHDLAEDLERIAAHFRTQENIEITDCPMLHFGSQHSREGFLALARVFPRPTVKRRGIGDFERFPEIAIEYRGKSMWAYAAADRNKLCRIIRPAIPAEYECEPLLSAEEEAQLGTTEVA